MRIALLKTLKIARGIAKSKATKAAALILNEKNSRENEERGVLIRAALIVMPRARIITKKNQSFRNRDIRNFIKIRIITTAKIMAKIIEIRLVAGATSFGGAIP